MTGLANQQQQQSGQLFNNVAYPDISTASSYYQKLASGNPNEIQAAVGPAASQIAAQTNATEQNIQDTSNRVVEQSCWARKRPRFPGRVRLGTL